MSGCNVTPCAALRCTSFFFLLFVLVFFTGSGWLFAATDAVTANAKPSDLSSTDNTPLSAEAAGLKR